MCVCVFSVYRTLGLVLQNENFNYNRYTNHIMESWSYMDTPMSKPRLNPGDDLAAITMLYEQCKVANALTHPNTPSAERAGYFSTTLCFAPYILISNSKIVSPPEPEGAEDGRH